MSRLRLLEMFAGEGGSGRGYELAGWDVYAVERDEERIARNPHWMHKGDVVDVAKRLLRGEAVDFHHPDGRVEWLRLSDFHASHWSPTCTGYSQGTVAIPDRFTRYDRLIGVSRALALEMGLPYVLENVERALPEMVDPVRLCGRMFGLSATDVDGTPLVLDRHRLFESSIPLEVPEHPRHPRRGEPGWRQVAGAYGGARRDKAEARYIRKGGYVPASLEVLQALLGVPWMSEKGAFLSVPPVYTQHIGRQLLTAVRLARMGATS